jgi:site-specific recombinase XerC
MRGEAVVGTPCIEAAELYVRRRRARGELRPASAGNIRNCLRRFASTLGDKQPGVITLRDVERWQEHRPHLSPGSRRSEIGIVAGWLDWLVAEGELRRNPLAGVPRPKQPRSVPAALPAPAVDRLLDVVAGDTRLNAVVWLMLGMGLRRGEVAAVDVEDWDRWGDVLLVHGKGGHERILPVPLQVRRALEKLLADNPRATGPLILNRWGERLSTAAITRFVGEALTEAGIKRHAFDRASAHALRHTCASDTLDACHDLRVVMQLLGHQSLATTSIYQRRSSTGELRDALEARRYA